MLAWMIIGICIFLIVSIVIAAFYWQTPTYSNLEPTPSTEPLQQVRDFRVVFTLTTTAANMPRIHLVLENLLESSIRADAIYLNVPKYSYQTNESYILSPELIQLQNENPRIEINWCADSGALNNILPVLSRESRPDTLIITASATDEYRPSNYHEDLLTHALDNPRRAYGYQHEELEEEDDMIILTNDKGAIYRRKFFDNDCIDTVVDVCFQASDMWIALSLQRQGIARKLVGVGMPPRILSEQELIRKKLCFEYFVEVFLVCDPLNEHDSLDEQDSSNEQTCKLKRHHNK